jgi:conjugal transfer pilus assembly protein TraW
MRGLTLALLMMTVPLNVQAKDFGTVGQTFQIVEEGFIEMIKRKLESVDIDGERIKMQNLAEDRVNNPKALIGIVRAVEDREFYYDPSIVVKEDILLPNGAVLHKAGTIVNPLDHINLDRRMIFINGRDESQVEWLRDELVKLEKDDKQDEREALKRSSSTAKSNDTTSFTSSSIIINRVILTGGKIMELQKQLGIELFFDQSGELTDRFGIRAVPAIAVQEGKQIKINEVAIKNNNDSNDFIR